MKPSADHLTLSPPAAPEPAGIRLTLPVEGMSCASCTGRVERALAALPGATEVAVNLATGRASLALPEGTPPARAVEAIREAGYVPRQRNVHYELIDEGRELAVGA